MGEGLGMILKKKISAYDFQNISNWFLNLLKDYRTKDPNLLSQKDLDHYRIILNDLI